MKQSLLHEAVQIALSKYKIHDEYENFIHFSFVVHNNKILSCGKNNKATPSRHMGYHSRVPTPKTHSEVNAYRKAKGLLGRDATFELINVRVNKSGEIRNSKPCNCCFNLLKVLGCKRFYYSSEVGFLSI